MICLHEGICLIGENCQKRRKYLPSLCVWMFSSSVKHPISFHVLSLLFCLFISLFCEQIVFSKMDGFFSNIILSEINWHEKKKKKEKRFSPVRPGDRGYFPFSSSSSSSSIWRLLLIGRKQTTTTRANSFSSSTLIDTWACLCVCVCICRNMTALSKKNLLSFAFDTRTKNV